MDRITTNMSAASTAASIGRIVEINLTNFVTGAMAELARADRAGEDAGPLLNMGLALLRARRAVRDGIRSAELQRLRGVK